MKNWILFILLFTGFTAKSGNFPFPNVEYSYAKLYLFNLGIKEPHQIDFMIYQDGSFAESKLGTGTLLSDEFNQKVQNVFKRGVDELIEGLGKCYIPRHGIIYYDSEHNPVASLSICFECDRIAIWSVNPYPFKDGKPENNYKNAERQIADLAKFVKAEGVPVYTSASEENRYWRVFKKDSNYIKPTIIELEATQELDSILNDITQRELKTWINASEGGQFIPSIDTNLTSDGIISGNIRMGFKDKSYFKFEGQYLKYAHIESTKIALPNGLAVGMSIAEIYALFNYEKPTGAYPTYATISNEYWKITLDFTYGTLRSIELIKA